MEAGAMPLAGTQRVTELRRRRAARAPAPEAGGERGEQRRHGPGRLYVFGSVYVLHSCWPGAGARPAGALVVARVAGGAGGRDVGGAASSLDVAARRRIACVRRGERAARDGGGRREGVHLCGRGA